MSGVDGFFVLPSDVTIRESTSADDLPSDLSAERLVISRRGVRAHPRLITRSAASFLEFFREPALVETVVVRYCEAHGGHPADVLSAMVPMLCDLMNHAYLVPPGSVTARSFEPSFSSGQIVGDFEIVRCLRASIDTNVYQCRHPGTGELAALKIQSAGRIPAAGDAISREARILAEVGGNVAPGLVGQGLLDGMRYLLMEWCEGASPEEVAASTRHQSDQETRRTALDACCGVLEAYAALHEAGILHVDVHPSNMIVTELGPARIIDFDAAVHVRDGQAAEAPHRRSDPYIEPEHAAARLNRVALPPATERGEQYVIASVLYRMLTGGSHVELSVIESELLRRVSEDDMRPFVQLGHPPWPKIEEALAQALCRDPQGRFGSVEELRSAFDAARQELPPRRVGSTLARLAASAGEIAERYAGLVTAAEGLDAPPDGHARGPESDDGFLVHSLALGSGGVAVGLLHIAGNRSDPALLAAADIWLTRSLRAAGVPPPMGTDVPEPPALGEVVLNVPEHTLLPKSSGTNATSLYLGLPGLHCADALVAISAGDKARALNSAGAFLAASSGVAEQLELYSGRAGTLVGLSLIHEACRQHLGAEIPTVSESGEALCRGILGYLTETGPAGGSPANLGMAHGWAGVLYGVMRWMRIYGRPLEDPMRDRLEEIASQGIVWGDTIRWPWVSVDASGEVQMAYSNGWCNGSAGFVHLWLLAYELAADDLYLERAVASARCIQGDRVRAAHLCCGASGAVYALLALFRVTEDEVWLERARRLIEPVILRLPRGLEETYRASMFRGEMGLAVAASEFASPEEARMPLFG